MTHPSGVRLGGRFSRITVDIAAGERTIERDLGARVDKERARRALTEHVRDSLRTTRDSGR
jgi:hypothetical protein